MASKRIKGRNRPSQAATPTRVNAPPVHGATATPSRTPKRSDEPTWFDELVRRFMNRLGSLQLAVILLTLFAAVLAIGTMMESWYSAQVAQVLVYRTWWFGLLMFGLATNIFFAAVKKAKLRGAEDVGRDLPGTGYVATFGYWWPWLLVAGIFCYLLVSDLIVPLSLGFEQRWGPVIGYALDRVHWTAVGVSFFFALALSFGLWTVQMTWPVERWWPWQRHQTGFLITHVGLLAMVAGGVLNALWGTDSMMTTVDTDDESFYHRHAQFERIEGSIHDRDRQLLKAVFLDKAGNKQKEVRQRFNPGVLTWHSDKNIEVKNDSALVSFLGWLQHPLPRYHRWDLGDGLRFEVENYYPHARVSPFSKAPEGNSLAFPALRLALYSPAAGEFPPFWVGWGSEHFLRQMGPGQVHLLGTCPEKLLDEFLRPPEPGQLGSKGILALVEEGRIYRVNVATALADRQWLPIGTSGRRLRVVEYLPNTLRDRDNLAPTDPFVTFEVVSASGVERYLVYGHSPGVALHADTEKPRIAHHLQVWYHAPDFRYGRGENRVRAVLQFVRAANSNELYYRSFSSRVGGFGLENAGPINVHDKVREPIPIWSGMDWRFQVVEYLPRAMDKAVLIPENKRPGFSHPEYRSVLRGRVTDGRESEEVWLVGQTLESDRGGQLVAIGDRLIRLHYVMTETKELPFKITLVEAIRKDHPGTNQPADFTSIVRLDDPERGIQGRKEIITMNQPLNHRGYKLYQTNMGPVITDRGEEMHDRFGNPIMQSDFTVGHDPGLSLKYAGTIMLALGIFCMFYMKAYFFKPRGRRAAPPPAADKPLERGQEA